MNIQYQATNMASAPVGQKFDFWQQVDKQDLLNWLLVRYHPHAAKCYYSYYVRYVDIFFCPTVDVELLKLAKHKRSWILQSIKRFGHYYAHRYGNREVKNLIARIIERYDLNRDLDQKDRIYLVSPQFIEEKISKIMRIAGDIGFTCRIGLLSGLRESEICYIKQKEICIQSFGCQCDKLRIASCNNGLCNCNKLDKRSEKSIGNNTAYAILGKTKKLGKV